jgi:hypothetical protein
MLETATKYENAHMTLKKQRELNQPPQQQQQQQQNFNHNSKLSPPMFNQPPISKGYNQVQPSFKVGNYDQNRQINTTKTNHNQGPSTSDHFNNNSQDVRRCYSCGASDHMKIDCPKLRSFPAPPPSSSNGNNAQPKDVVLNQV